MFKSVIGFLEDSGLASSAWLVAKYLFAAWIASLLAGWLMGRFVERSVEKMAEDRNSAGLDSSSKEDRIKRLRTVTSVASAAFKVVIWAAAIAVIVVRLDIPTGPFSVVIGAAGVALGFGAQSLIKDFLNGAFIIGENQYKIGDFVKIGNFEGEVKHITMRLTILRDREAKVHYIPNGSVTAVTNMTDQYSRMEAKFKVPSDTDVAKLKAVVGKIKSAVLASKEVAAKLKDSKMSDRVSSLDGGIGVVIGADTLAGDQWDVEDFTRRIIFEEVEKAKLKLV